MDNSTQRLLEIILSKSLKYNAAQPFKLAAGGTSPYYFDLRQTTLDAEGMYLAGQIFFNLLANSGIQAVGGVGVGAAPLVMSTVLAGYRQGQHLQAFLVRKEVKDYGMQRPVEGNIQSGMRAVIVEDVLTTGNSALFAVEKARAAGLDVQQVLALLDREEGGLQALAQHSLDSRAIFTKTEILCAYKNFCR